LEKKTSIITASLVIVAFLVGLLIGGGIRPGGSQSTITFYQIQTVTVAATTVEVPIRHQPVVYASDAYTWCAFIVTGGENVSLSSVPCKKLVKIDLWLRQLGTEESYIKPEGVIILTPGLDFFETAKLQPVDYKGRAVIIPGTRTQISVTAEVTDLTSLINWLRDVGTISLLIRYENRDGQELGEIKVEGIPLREQSWKLGTNSTEVAPGG
jgi:hypothetical protein